MRHAELGERPPVGQRHADIDQWHLHQLVQRRLLRLGQFRGQVGDHHVPAGQHPMGRPHPAQFAAAQVVDHHSVGAAVADVDRQAVQADAHRAACPIQRRIVGSRQHYVLGARARQGGRDQLAHQQPRHRGVAVGEVEGRRAAGGRVARRGIAHAGGTGGIELQSLESRQAQAPAVQRRLGLDADAPLAMGGGPVVGDHPGVGLDHLQQVVAVADARQPIHLLGGVEVGQVVDLGGLDAHDIGLDLGRQRRGRQPGGERLGVLRACVEAAEADHEFVGAEGLLVEEHRRFQPGVTIEVLVGAGLGQGDRIDAQLGHQAGRDRAVGAGAVDQHGPAVQQQGAAADVELVALGVAAEVVVVLQHQDAGVGLGLAPEVRCGQAADPAADHHQIVGLVVLHRLAGVELAVAQGVGRLERPRMAAAHPRAGGRVVAGLVGGCGLGDGGGGGGQGWPLAEQGGAGSQRHAVQEVAPVEAHANCSLTARWAWSMATSV